VERLQKAGVSVRHLHVSTLKPFTDPAIDDAIRSARTAVVTVENHSIIGGLGSCVAERMASLGSTPPLIKIGIPDSFAHGASAGYLFKKYGLDAHSIATRVAKLFGVTLEGSDSLVAGTAQRDTRDDDQLEAL